MIVYADTSAILKRYFQESFSEEVLLKWKKADAVVTSTVAYAETLATIYRKKKEAGLKRSVIQNILQAFRNDWDTIIRVEVTEDLNEYLETIIQRHTLRGFDAVHLSSALIIHEHFPRDFFFACFDQRLNRAAIREGFKTFQ